MMVIGGERGTAFDDLRRCSSPGGDPRWEANSLRLSENISSSHFTRLCPLTGGGRICPEGRTGDPHRYIRFEILHIRDEF